MEQSKFYQIKNITEHEYTLVGCDGSVITRPIQDIDKSASAFTIKDAKAGDVLACENGWTCIFKTLVNDEAFSSYCFMDNTKWFCGTGSEGHTLKEEFVKAYNGEIHPATKEQRDLLFTKMKEAGYEWGSEKNELRKIEQKPVEIVKWSPQEESCICQLESLVKEQWRYAEKVNNAVDIKKMQELMFFLKTLNPNKKSQRIVLAEAKEAMYDKSAWSEEDEKRIKKVMHILSLDGRINNEELKSILDWLKSLKERVQPKQEWSEEDIRKKDGVMLKTY